jgi:putative membrane protein
MPPVKMDSEEFKVRLQIETSLLNWVRTSLALMGFGFVVARFGLFLKEVAQAGQDKLQSHPGLAAVNTVTGTTLIALGVAVLLLSVVNHRRLVAGLERGELDLPLRWSLGVVLSLVLAALGMGLAVYLTVVEL